MHFENVHSWVFKQKFGEAVTEGAKNKYAREYKIRRLEYIQHLTNIVTVNGRPFAYLQDSGIVGLAARELQFLQDAGHGEGLTGVLPPAVMSHIDFLTSEIQRLISLEVRYLLVSLMVDIGSRNGRSILGLSIQFMCDGKISVRSIEMVLLTISHTGVKLKQIFSLVWKRLESTRNRSFQ